MAKTSIIIPTYHRPKELRDCLESILEQTVSPDEVIVVDDGELDGIPLQAELEAAGIRVVYHRKDTPGLTESRNVGISLSTGDIIFFLDDDVTLLPDYIEQIMRVYDAHDEHVVGVGGEEVEPVSPGLPYRMRRWVNIFFLTEGFREGRVLPSGFCTEIGASGRPLTEPFDVDFLSGGICSYRRHVFNEFRFTDKYRTFGFGEDKDFSYPVAKKYRLLVNPLAKVYHHQAKSMRPNKYLFGRKFVVGRYLFFRDHVRRAWWHSLLFGYAVFGYGVIRTLIMIATLDPTEFARLRGIVGAVWDIALGRLDRQGAPRSAPVKEAT